MVFEICLEGVKRDIPIFRRLAETDSREVSLLVLVPCFRKMLAVVFPLFGSQHEIGVAGGLQF